MLTSKVAFIDKIYSNKDKDIVGVKIDYGTCLEQKTVSFKADNISMDFEDYTKDFTVVDGVLASYSYNKVRNIEIDKEFKPREPKSITVDTTFMDLLSKLALNDCLYFGEELPTSRIMVPNSFLSLKVTNSIINIYIRYVDNKGNVKLDCLVDDETGPVRCKDFYFGVPYSNRDSYFGVNCSNAGSIEVNGIKYRVYKSSDDLPMYSDSFSSSSLEGFIVYFVEQIRFANYFYSCSRHLLKKMVNFLDIEAIGGNYPVEEPPVKSPLWFSPEPVKVNYDIISKIFVAILNNDEFTETEVSEYESRLYDMVYDLRIHARSSIEFYKMLFELSQKILVERTCFELRLSDYRNSLYYQNYEIKSSIERPEFGGEVFITRRLGV